MTRIKKFIVAGLMAVITMCVSIGSALVNISQSLFSWMKVGASTSNYDYSNTNDGNAYKDGDIIQIDKLPSEGKVNSTIEIPKTITIYNVNQADTSITALKTIVDIRNPYGDKLVYTEETVDGGVTHNIGEIIDSNQVSIDAENYVDATKYLLRPSQVGVYTVQYAVQNAQGVWTVSEVFSIQVKKEAYTIEMSANDPIVLPSQIDTNQGVSTEVKLPLPKIFDENGKQIKQFVLGNEGNSSYYVAEYKDLAGKDGEHEYVVALDDNNVPQVYDYNDSTSKANIPSDRNVYTSYETYVIKSMSAAEVEEEQIEYGLYIEAYNAETGTPVSNLKSSTEDVSMPLNYSGTGEQYYIADAYSFTAGSGKNIIRYRLCNKDLSNYATPYSYLSDITIEGTTNISKNDISLGASTTTNVIYSDTSLMEKCYLPKVSAVDKNNNSNSLNAYYYYEVEYIGDLSDTDTSNDSVANGKDAKYVTLGEDEKGLYFIPKVKGTYNIYYNAEDFYGNTDENADKYDYDVVIIDRIAPNLQLTKSYDFDNLDNNIISEDYSYVVPTKYYTSSDTTDSSKWTKIAIPAVYATDNVLSFDDLIITRTITSESGFKNISSYGKTEKNYNISIQNSASETTYDVTVKDENGDSVVLKNIISFDVANYTDFYTKVYDGEESSKANNIRFYGNDDNKELTSGSLEFKKAKSSQVAYITLNPNLFGEGTYTIRFSVADKNGSSSNTTGDTFTFQLVYADSADEVDADAPTVEFKDDEIVDVEDKQQITINKPVIKDAVDTGSSKTSTRKITLDKYYVLIENQIEDANHNLYTFVPLTLTSEDTLTFNTSTLADGVNSIYQLAVAVGKFKVVCFSYDDFAKYDVDPTANFADFKANLNAGVYKNIGFGEFEMTVKNIYDTVAPKFAERTSVVSEYTNTNAYNQYGEAKVNGIVFYDNTPADKISVKVIDSKGNLYEYEELDGAVSKIEKIADTDLNDQGYFYKYTLSGIKFTANKADSYTINISVTDEGNNTFSYSYVLVTATDKETPVITEILGLTNSMELGTSKKFSVTATDNTEGANITYQVKVLDQDGRNVSFMYFNTETMTFTPKSTGTYTIQIQANDGFENLSSAETFQVKVSDTQGPEIEYFGNQTIEAIPEGKDKNSTNSNGDTIDWDKVFPEVELSGFTITDVYQTKNGFAGVFGATGTLTITNPDGDSYTITNSQTTIEGNNPLNIRREGSSFFFTPTERGEYKVAYSGTDNSGNTATNEKTVKVTIGDTEKPVVKLSNNLLETLKNGFVIGSNDNLLVNTKVLFESKDNLKQSKTDGDIYLTDNFGFKNLGDGAEDSDVYTNVSVQVLDANNNSVSYTTETNESTGVDYEKFTFTTAGTYTINFTATDSVGNSYTLAKTFKVSTVSESASESSKVLGIVLISVSILILAGVIIYFVRGTKFLPKKKKAKKEIAQKEENKD